MKASDVMDRGPFLTVSPETTLENAARLMLEQHVSGLPVLDEKGKPCGILTEGDLMRRAEIGTTHQRRHWTELLVAPGRLAQEYTNSHGCKVGEIMSSEVISATAETPLVSLVDLMEKHHIKRIPIVEGDQLVGIVSRIDLVRAMLDHLPTPVTAGRTDADILKDLKAVFESEIWAPRANVRAEVMNGTVSLSGLIFDERERTALRVAAETVPGVTSVSDDLVTFDPVLGMPLNAGMA